MGKLGPQIVSEFSNYYSWQVGKEPTKALYYYGVKVSRPYSRQ